MFVNERATISHLSCWEIQTSESFNFVWQTRKIQTIYFVRKTKPSNRLFLLRKRNSKPFIFARANETSKSWFLLGNEKIQTPNSQTMRPHCTKPFLGHRTSWEHCIRWAHGASNKNSNITQAIGWRIQLAWQSVSPTGCRKEGTYVCMELVRIKLAWSF